MHNISIYKKWAKKNQEKTPFIKASNIQLQMYAATKILKLDIKVELNK